MRWINSAGGPLICAERFIAENWMGIDGLSVSDVTNAKTDYDRACGVSEYVMDIPCASHRALVLDDEPMQSAFVNTEGCLPMVARWVYAGIDQDVREILRTSIDRVVEIAKPIAIEIYRDSLVMFDAALRGSNLRGEYAETSIRPGRYYVTTDKLERTKQYCFLIHRLLEKE